MIRHGNADKTMKIKVSSATSNVCCLIHDACCHEEEARLHQMGGEGLSFAVPEGIYKYLVVFDGYWTYCRTQIKSSALEHDTVFVVDASAFWKDQQRSVVCSLNMLLHSLLNNPPILDLQ